MLLRQEATAAWSSSGNREAESIAFKIGPKKAIKELHTLEIWKKMHFLFFVYSKSIKS